MTDKRAFWGPFLSDKGDRSHPDPDNVRKAELFYQPRQRVRVTVVSMTGHMRVFTVHKSPLATVLETLYAAERQT